MNATPAAASPAEEGMRHPTDGVAAHPSRQRAACASVSDPHGASASQRRTKPRQAPSPREHAVESAMQVSANST